MLKLERFLPGFNHILCGHPPKTASAKFQEKITKLRQSTLSELSIVFGDFVPIDKLALKEKGTNSRERINTLNVTFGGFLFQVLIPGTPGREVVRKVQSFCSEKELSLPSSNDAAYCKARARIKDSDLENVHYQVCEKVERRVIEDQRWKGRTSHCDTLQDARLGASNVWTFARF